MPKWTKQERVDAVGKLKERNKKVKNQLDQISDDYKKKQGGLSKRNRAIFDD